MIGSTLRSAARLGWVLLCLLSATYGVVAYTPFTYQAAIKADLVGWLPAFVRLHPVMVLAVLAANLAADLERLRRPGIELRLFYLLHAAAGVTLLARPALAGAGNDRGSYLLAVTFLTSALWLLSLDLREPRPAATPTVPVSDGGSGRLWVASLGTAAGSALLFTGLAAARAEAAGGAGASTGLLVRSLAWSLTGHLLLFQSLALVGFATSAIGRLSGRPWVEPVLVAVSGWAAGLVFLEVMVFRTIGLSGADALLLAGLASAVLVLSPGRLGVAVLRAAVRNGPFAAAAALLGIALLGATLLAGAERFDWNFLLQKCAVALVWILAFAWALAWPARRPVGRAFPWAITLAPLATLILFQGVSAWGAAATSARRGAPAATPWLERWVALDPSARLLRELLLPARQGSGSIYRWLQANANLPPALRTDPVVVSHVTDLRPGDQPRPDIYLVVVDSLRRDYLGAYSAGVHFTPNLDRFALESVVMRNAFTRYGATGLSEPSIWVGGMMLHQQYPVPFRRLNALQRLLQTDGYELLVSMDSVMEAVIDPGPGVGSLDPGVPTQDLRLGTTLERLGRLLEHRPEQAPPLFVYTQAQDLHVSVIHREGEQPVGAGDFGSAYAPYASRVQRLDQAFGAFLELLRRTGRYERSIIILTSDHGDSLGEEGRFGHAYTLFPEVIRIPLLIHLPVTLRGRLRFDANAPAFLTDLTPSLYELLGHRPILRHPILGRPLFAFAPGADDATGADQVLLASSYGAVFGILDGGGKRLYVADAVNFEDHLFSLEGAAGGTRLQLSAEAKRRFDRLIVEKLGELNRYYHFDPGPPPGESP